MAYYEMVTLIFISICMIIMFCIGYCIGKSKGVKEVQIVDYQSGYKEGFNDAKKYFYDDPKKEREEEQQHLMEQIQKANSALPPITSELLMAYGVESTAQLPKRVREIYGIKESVDLDTLIHREVEQYGVQ